MTIAQYNTPEINAIQHMIETGVVILSDYTVRDGALFVSLMLTETEEYDARIVNVVLR